MDAERFGHLRHRLALIHQAQGKVDLLGCEHINMLGRYAFSLPAKIARRELRPLRNPAQVDLEAA